MVDGDLGANAETGCQMGLPNDPHDQWDYDGVNEMILADQPWVGHTAGAGPLRSQWSCLPLDRANGELIAGRSPIRP